MSQKEEDPSSANPMLYDPIQDGIGTTRKAMQFVAATLGNLWIKSPLEINLFNFHYGKKKEIYEIAFSQ